MKNLQLLFFIFSMSISVLVKSQTTDSTFVETPITLQTTTGKIYGTLTMPKTNQKIPVVLIVAGSGPTDRNCNSYAIGLNTNSYSQLAHELAKSDIASIRFDKRGIAESKDAGNEEKNLRFDMYINDANSWIELLRKDKRFSSIIVIGHSEGSLVGMVAGKNANKFISLDGAGEPANLILKKQLKAQMPEAYFEKVSLSLDTLTSGDTLKYVDPNLMMLFRPSVQPYMISWFKYDPQKEIKKLTIPILIVQGNRDLQVTEDDAKLLKEANSKAKMVVIDSMNHVLKDVSNDKTENLKSYSNPDLPIDHILVQKIVSFIKD
ncbi:MAG: alpha/beta hydrolase [Pseudopedobacter saltans]|uniref:Alpha/beta hydrolase n=1 Tax=Pseudopedobacter saltans TaxID=151895 RepID=A0A2W5F003_9SPHI|nr:MAG: alpha/beta hydrolase [Pseudopedobacter saltans]